MATTVDIASMSTAEKLRLMEDLWVNLSSGDPEIESPSWHEGVLHERERLTSTGEEKPVDWELAKRQLREELL